jgi:hypothetical protein
VRTVIVHIKANNNKKPSLVRAAAIVTCLAAMVARIRSGRVSGVVVELIKKRERKPIERMANAVACC